jgi:hypothetical protein
LQLGEVVKILEEEADLHLWAIRVTTEHLVLVHIHLVTPVDLVEGVGMEVAQGALVMPEAGVPTTHAILVLF